MKILIGGDVVPTAKNIHLFDNCDINSLLGDKLANIWQKVDYRIFNLEVPITDNPNPINKSGPNLFSPTSTIEGIAALNPSLVSLANNHILDQGQIGLESTESLLNYKKIPHIGSGSSLAEASRPFILKTKDCRVGVYACAEHEFTIADERNPGANPFDPLESLDHINLLKKKTDFVIVLFHGGIEHYRYPSPCLQKVCRKMVEKGANLVITQHSHCVGSYDKYCNGTIVYGQGNFVFNYLSNEYWDTSILVEVNTEKNNISFIPLKRTKDGTSLAEGAEGTKILDDLEYRSKEILEEGFIERSYIKFVHN